MEEMVRFDSFSRPYYFVALIKFRSFLKIFQEILMEWITTMIGRMKYRWIYITAYLKIWLFDTETIEACDLNVYILLFLFVRIFLNQC